MNTDNQPTMDNLFSLDAISKTGLDKIEISPLDYWYSFLNPNRKPYVPSADTVFNDALRCAVFNTSEFSKTYVRQPILNKKTNIGKSEFANLLEQTSKNNQILIGWNEFELIKVLQTELLKHPTVKLLLTRGVVGKPTRFVEKKSGAIVKFQPHFLSDDFVIDLSATDKADAWNFTKEVTNLSLHKKAALQLDGTGASEYIFIRIEKTEPYKISIYTLDERSIEYGQKKYIENCHTYAECLKSGKWYGYDRKINVVRLPEWVYNT